MMRKLTWNTMTVDEREWIHRRGQAHEDAAELRGAIRTLVEDVRDRGDAALLDALARFDRVEVDAAGLRVSDAEFARALSAIDPGAGDHDSA